MAVPKGTSPKTTPMSVMGGQGKNITVKPSYVAKPTKKTMFPC